MKCMLTLPAAVFLVCALPLAATAQPTPKAPSASSPSDPDKQTGQRIGAIVSSAIDTAFPVIGKILDLFKPDSKATDKVTKSQVETAVSQARSDYVSQAKLKLQPLTGLAKELKVIQAFATAGVAARSNVQAMTTVLGKQHPDADRLDVEWTIAKNYLGAVVALSAADLQAVREASIRERCLAVQNAHRDLFVRIDANVKKLKGVSAGGAAAEELKTQLAALTELLRGFDSLATMEVGTLQDDVDSLAKWANGAAGPGDFKSSLREPPKPLLAIVDAAAAAARAAVPAK